MREELKVDYMKAEWDSQWLLDIFSQCLSSSPYDSVTDVTAVRDNDKRSLCRTDAQLAVMKNCATAVEGMRFMDH